MKQKKLIIFFDSGDTIIDESTEIRDSETGVVMTADTIPGIVSAIHHLHTAGHRMAIVADGMAESFKNILGQAGVLDCFETLAYSETVKAAKPSPRMFKAAMGAMELTERDTARIVMIGNNLARDIKGANQLGITSVHMAWTPRYPKLPSEQIETPVYTVNTAEELLVLISQLEEDFCARYPNW